MTTAIKLALAGGAVAGATLFGGAIASADTITVNQGDTLNKLAETHKTTVDHLAKVNNIADINVIYAGQELETDFVTFENNEVAPQVEETPAPTIVLPEPQEPVVATTYTQAPVAQPAPVQEAPAPKASGNSGAGYVAQKIAANTGTSVDTWNYIVDKESTGNGSAVNATSGAYGYFQLLGHGEYAGMSDDEQVEMATKVYHDQGFTAWEVMN